MAAELSKRSCTVGPSPWDSFFSSKANEDPQHPQEDAQLHLDAMRQPTDHAQQLPGADKTDDDLTAEAHARLWADRINNTHSHEAHAANGDTDMPLPLLESCCLMPFRQSINQEQLLCDSCGGVFFDENAKIDNSFKTGPSGLLFHGTNFMDRQHSFEIMNQGTAARRNDT